MKKSIQFICILLFTIPISVAAQKPEKQISFAKETKSHEYYVKQAELWWLEIQRDKTSEDSWYNYFRACRNAQGTANWREDFVKESPYLKSGKDIVKLMEENIPDTFTFNYVAYSIQGIDPTKGSYLVKAYEKNPRYDGINAAMVTYAVSILDPDLRKKVNVNWYPLNELSPGLLDYAYNVLMSVEPNSILLTQHDNDSYPIWMLQDVKGIHSDVTVINFDFLLLDSYRQEIFNRLNIKQFDLKLTDNYQVNWQNVLRHFLTNYGNDRPLYFAMTVSENLYKEFADKMTGSGLAYRFRDKPQNIVELNKNLIENRFLLDYLKIQLIPDSNQKNVDQQNINYLKCFKTAFDYYKFNQNLQQAGRIQELSQNIAKQSGDETVIKSVTRDFR